MYKTKVSIIVPVYNTEKWMLKKCFDSIIQQTIKEIELIIVDDGSKEEIAKFCDEYSFKNKEIVKVIHNENAGVSVARNIGISQAKGEYLTFVDSDDWISEKYLEDLLKGFSKEVDIVMCTRFFEYKEKTIPSYFLEKDYIFDKENKEVLISKSLTSGIAGTWCKIYKKEFIEKNNLRYSPKLRRTQDIIFNLYAFSKAKKIRYINECKYHYRMQNESMTKKFNSNADTVLTLAAEEFIRFIELFYPKNKELEQLLYYKCILILNEILKLKYLNPNYNKENKKIYLEILKITENRVYSMAIKKYNLKNYPNFIGKIKVICLKKKWYFLLKILYRLQLYIEYRRNY